MEIILLVEALIAEQQRVTKNLTDAGFVVTACGDSDWALAYWWQYRPSVVVIGDAFGKRITDSEQLVESIKELNPGQPIVMLRKSDAQLLLEVSAHKQRLPLFPFNSESL
jgi:DNA-binding response OmpR family regulator